MESYGHLLLNVLFLFLHQKASTEVVSFIICPSQTAVYSYRWSHLTVNKANNPVSDLLRHFLVPFQLM